MAEALSDGRLVPGFRPGNDPLALADVTIYVPTRRAARELRTDFVERAAGRPVILPSIRPLGEFDEDGAAFHASGEAALDLAPPIAQIDRLLLLAPLVRLWKQRLPAHVAAKFAEEFVVPASSADAIWLARDLAALVDEVETEGSGLGETHGAGRRRSCRLVAGDARFPCHRYRGTGRRILQRPAALQPGGAPQRADPGRSRGGLKAHPPAGPVIAAGSTGSIPATAELLSVIARLPHGALVLPGLDTAMDEASWTVLADPAPEPAVLGHPQFGLAKLLRASACSRADVEEIACRSAAAGMAGQDRRRGASSRRARPMPGQGAAPVSTIRRSTTAFAGVALVEAAHERDEAAAIAIALRRAVDAPGRTAALVTGDRDLARRVSAELLRFGIRADDSGGTPLAGTPPAALLTLMLGAVFQPGDPVPVLSLLKHPLLALGLGRAAVRRAVEVVELVALRGGYGRPDISTLADLFEQRLTDLPATIARRSGCRASRPSDIDKARAALGRLARGAVAARCLCRAGRDAAVGESRAPRSWRWKAWRAAPMAGWTRSTPERPAKSSLRSCAAWFRRTPTTHFRRANGPMFSTR